jgi:AcrR family transcriptional regulator
VPKVSDQYLDSRRRQILDAALICFGQNGFHETTIQDIARQAGLSLGAIYRYFPSKGEIIYAAAQRDAVARGRRFEDAEKDPSSIQALDRLLTNASELQDSPQAITKGQLAVQIMSEGVRNPRVNAAILQTWEDVLGRVAAIVRRGQAAGEIDPDLDPEAVARLLAVIHDGLVVHNVIEPDLDVAACFGAIGVMLQGWLAVSGTESQEVSNGSRRSLRSPAQSAFAGSCSPSRCQGSEPR